MLSGARDIDNRLYILRATHTRRSRFEQNISGRLHDAFSMHA